jgi:cytochrome c-type biogenesis protein CcmH/NrfG
MVTTRKSPSDKVPASPAFEPGLKALAAAEWQRACNLLREALAQYPDHAEGWEALAEAAWWVPDEEAIFEARERAYHLYRKRADNADAA